MVLLHKFVGLLVFMLDDTVLAIPKLLLVSLDGFRWDYIHKPAKLPNIRSVINNGVTARKGLKNTFITKTIPNHYTLVTGLYAESHGMVANIIFDPELNKSFHPSDPKGFRNPRWFKGSGEPIWVTNQARGADHRSGVVFWPGCGPVNGITPTQYAARNKSVTFREEIDMLITWFTNNSPINLGILYKGEPDHTGHKYGPFSEEVDDKLDELDADIGYLFDKLEQHDLMSCMNMIITSDHGMTTIYQEDDHKINLDNYIDLSSYNIFTSNPVADIRPKSAVCPLLGLVMRHIGQVESLKNMTCADNEEQRRKTLKFFFSETRRIRALIFELLVEIYKNLSNVPHLTVYKKDDIPLQYHYSKNERIAPILAVADEHYWISHNNSGTNKGNHGYNNSLPTMHPLFIAMGPSFKKNASVEILNNVDVYPLMCHILKLTPAPNNGTLDVVKHLLVESQKETVDIYILVITCACLVSGIVGVIACIVRRRRKLRHRRTDISNIAYTKVNTQPLMSETSEEEL